jgi:hypothetical protein
MPTIAVFRRVSARVVDEVRVDPERIKPVLFPPATETMVDDDVRVDIDTSWHGLHFLLTGRGEAGTASLDFILGGTPVGDIDLGRGPARSFTAAEVRKVAAALALVTANDLRARFDAARMMELAIYPAHWDAGAARDPLATLLGHFATLKDFVTTTAEAEAGMLVYLV